MLQEVGNSNTTYLSIVGGNMVQKVDEDHPDARKREYETSDGAKGTKWEKSWRNLSGFITGIDFEKSNFGTQVRLTLQKGEERVILSFPYESDYFTDFAKRICGADLTKEVVINPYAMTVEGKEYKKRGISLKQDGEKLGNYFFDFDKKKSLHGFPEVSASDRKNYDSDSWKLFFLTVRAFLKKKVQELVIPEYTPQAGGGSLDTPSEPAAKEENQEKELPFLKGRKKK